MENLVLTQKIGTLNYKIRTTAKNEELSCKIKMQFSPLIAKQVGVEEAIMYSNIQYWCAKNEANKKGFFRGYFWTYNSIEAFSNLFPFWTEKQIKRILNNLKNHNLIRSRQLNDNKYNKTNYYTDIGGFLEEYEDIINDNYWNENNEKTLI